MSIVENKNLNPELVANVHEDLQPTKERIMGSLSYTASFLGGCVSIGTFSMGASLIGVLTITGYSRHGNRLSGNRRSAGFDW